MVISSLHSMISAPPVSNPVIRCMIRSRLGKAWDGAWSVRGVSAASSVASRENVFIAPMAARASL